MDSVKGREKDLPKGKRKMTRITRDEIESTIEMFVNSIYDEGENSGWLTASLADWIKAVYNELINWKTIDGCSYTSNENRFEGKVSIMKRVLTSLIKRLKELKEEGYEIRAI